MDHPSVEIRFPFDGGEHRLGVPTETTQFYWGAIGLGTLTEPVVALREQGSISQTGLLEATRDRVSCSLTLDGSSEALLQDVRRCDDRRQHSFWKALDPAALPISATVTLSTDGEAPMVDGEPAALWTHDGEVIPWTETVRTDLRLLPAEETLEMKTDGLWDRHDVFVPRVSPERDSP